MAVSVVDRHAGNLPADVTSFVGRRRELAEVRDLLQHARLITLTGMGGVGKTRLAIRAGDDVHRAFPDGVWLVELAGLLDAGLVGQSVADALGLREESVGWSIAGLSDLIAGRRLLLILDNCEHLLDACAVLADALLKTSPGLRILSTSRQPLSITGEHCVEIHPLVVPEADASSWPGMLAMSEAVTLFTERAAAAAPGFHLDQDNQAAVAGICRRLDGNPLALELAARRLRALSIGQLLSRLDSRYEVLVGGSRAAPPRQQTLRALIDWSFALCSPAEQVLWARLSVFSDGFGLDSAEQVCSDEQVQMPAILDTVAGLVDKSIVTADMTGGEVRYRLPETLREYGLDRLAEFGEVVAVQARARDWCRTLVVRMQSGWFGPNQADLLAALRREHGNIRTALNFCLSEPGESDAGMAIAGGLRLYWTASGRLSEGKHWLDQLLARDSHPSRARLEALCTDAHLTSGPPANVGVVDQMLDEADALANDLADASGSADVSQVRGVVMLLRSCPDRAARLLESAAEGHRAVADRGGVAYDLGLLAMAKIVSANSDGVRAIIDECLAAASAAGENWIQATALWALGVEMCKQGDFAGAIAAQRRSIELRMPLEARYLMALNLDVLAWAAVRQSDCERAARLFGAADAIMQDVGGSLVSRGPTSGLHDDYKAQASRQLGPTEFRAAFDVGRRMGFDDAIAYALGSPAKAASEVIATGSSPASAALTRREFEVAQLVARGLTNKQIAAALVISQRTAEGHVEHVLSKLGFTTRAQIATWMAEQTTRDYR